MRIEEVEAMFADWENAESSDVPIGLLGEALDALRAEAWHPIEKAEEMGAKDGRYVLIWSKSCYWLKGEWFNNDGWFVEGLGFVHGATHFRFINPPEGS